MLWKIFLRPLGALVIAAVIAAAAAIALNKPPILEEPGIGVRTWTYLTQNSAATADISAFPELRTRRYQEPAGEVFQAALAAARTLDWELVDVDEKSRSLRAIATTRLWRFKDEVLLTVGEAEQGGSFLQMSSSSHFGRADFGSNARRITVFQELLERRL